jgi:hypothetical protein
MKLLTKIAMALLVIALISASVSGSIVNLALLVIAIVLLARSKSVKRFIRR